MFLNIVSPENLLQIKKARLLKELDDSEELNPTDAESTFKEPELDDEYSAFQVMIFVVVVSVFFSYLIYFIYLHDFLFFL